MSSFHVDARIDLKIEYDLAIRLGEFILSSGTDDKQFLALGHKLSNLDKEEEFNSPQPRQYVPTRRFYHEKEIIRSAGKILNEAEESFGSPNFDEEPRTPINVRSRYNNS